MLSMDLYLRNFFKVIRLLANSQITHKTKQIRRIVFVTLAWEPGSSLIISWSFGILN